MLYTITVLERLVRQKVCFIHSHQPTLEIISKFNVVMYNCTGTFSQVCQFLEKGWSVKSSSAQVLCQGIKIDLRITMIDISLRQFILC